MTIRLTYNVHKGEEQDGHREQSCCCLRATKSLCATEDSFSGLEDERAYNYLVDYIRDTLRDFSLLVYIKGEYSFCVFYRPGIDSNSKDNSDTYSILNFSGGLTTEIK